MNTELQATFLKLTSASSLRSYPTLLQSCTDPNWLSSDGFVNTVASMFIKWQFTIHLFDINYGRKIKVYFEKKQKQTFNNLNSSAVPSHHYSAFNDYVFHSLANT